MDYPRIAFIGAGNMANAIIGGLMQSGYPSEKIIVANPGTEKLRRLSEKFSIQGTQNNGQAIENADLIFLAVKPSVVQTVCEELSSNIQQQLIISIAAGKTIASIKKYLKADNPVIRAMPNTPCLLSKGSIGIFAETKVSEQSRKFISQLFENIGELVWLDNEQQLDIVTALSGSGPAYYFYLTEALIQAGVSLGLDPEISKKLTLQTALGAVAMLNEKPLQSAETLRKAVTSPHGTTAAAIEVFNDQNFMQLITSAVRCAAERAKEMSEDSN